MSPPADAAAGEAVSVRLLPAIVAADRVESAVA
jgi:hypothetical protein